MECADRRAPAADDPRASGPRTPRQIMNAPRPAVVVTFRDADERRALASRMIAVAHRHPRGWTVNTSDGSRAESVTFDAAADAVTAITGVRRLLVVWPGETGTAVA